MSLFLQDGLQRNDGAIALHYATALPPGAEMPGKITAYDVSGAPLGVDTFAFPRAELIKTARLGPPPLERFKAPREPHKLTFLHVQPPQGTVPVLDSAG